MAQDEQSKLLALQLEKCNYSIDFIIRHSQGIGPIVDSQAEISADRLKFLNLVVRRDMIRAEQRTNLRNLFQRH